ncbi:MAG TPA: hypothetical protein VM912_02270 [Terriglobales bacterium]|nr:hypothetical protein [Terriglobales bacterium]
MNSMSPDSASADYVEIVLKLYLGLPDTPLRARTPDRKLARQFQERGLPLHLVESAFLLASVRRLARPVGVPPLEPIRSLAYFQPVIEELLSSPVPEGYLQYLQLKLRQFAAAKSSLRELLSAEVQKHTLSDDR